MLTPFLVTCFLALAPTAATTSADELRHAQLAEEWCSANGVAPDEVAGEHEPLDALVARTFARIELGGLRILVPPGDAGLARTVEAVETLFDVHETWARWNTTGDPGAKLPKDVAKARKAIDKWCKKDLAAALAAVPAGEELFATAGLDDKAAEAFAAWNDWVLASSGARFAGGARAELVLLPTRSQFVEFACFLGQAMPALQGVYWAEDIATWSELDYYDTRVSPLAYASSDPLAGYAEEYPMDSKNNTGLRQHVAQVAARSLIDTGLGTSMDPILAGGLANVLVIDLFEQVDTKIDGDMRSNTTTGRSQFIPASAGGQSAGGSLPPVSAESRWRVEKGKGYFVRQLQLGQRAGSKEVEEKADQERTFVLQSDTGDDKRALAAPLLHASVAKKRVDRKFLGDYAELVRAYRVAFLHWLRDESSKDSNDRFAALLEALAAAGGPDEEGADFLEVVARTYEVPLSAELPSEDDLEGRFLRWLAK